MSTEFFILAILLLINSLMATALLMAARSLGQPTVARVWAGAFGCNVVMYLINGAYISFFRDNILLLCVMSSIAMLGPMLAASGFHLRSGLPIPFRRLAVVQLLGLGLILWFSLGDPNNGARGSIVPFFAAAILLWGIRAMWRPGRTLLLGERPTIVTGLAMATTETIGGVALALRGREPNATLENVYMLVVFIGLPAMTLAAGVFTLYLLASDLADQLRQIAETDPLTGAANRRAIEAEGQRLIDDARRQSQPLCAALCDLDQFKYINDRFGHALGDEVLRSVSRLFDGHAAQPHHGRYGGEEFLLFFPGRDIDATHDQVERLRRDIMALPIEGLPIQITASFGITRMEPNDTLAGLIKRADQALYQSKQAGRNRTTIAQTEPAPAAQALATSRS